MGYKTNYRLIDSKQVTYDKKKMVVDGYFDKQKSKYAHVALTHANGEITGTLEVAASLLPIFQKLSDPLKKGKTSKSTKS